eukprot:m51a1_g9712 hypothetical protein (772) ;mRNA; f:1406699-1409588
MSTQPLLTQEDIEADERPEAAPEEQHLLSRQSARPSLLQLLARRITASSSSPKLPSPREHPPQRASPNTSPSLGPSVVGGSAESSPRSSVLSPSSSSAWPQQSSSSSSDKVVVSTPAGQVVVPRGPVVADAGLLCRMLDESAAPGVVPGEDEARAVAPAALQGPGTPRTKLDELLVQVTEPGEASASDGAAHDSAALALYQCSRSFRTRANAAMRSGADAGPWAAFVADHLTPAVRSLRPYRGFLYTCVERSAVFGPTRAPSRGQLLAWRTFASASTDDGQVLAVCQAASTQHKPTVVLQAFVSEGAWLLPARPASSSSLFREVVLEPGWVFDVACAGVCRGGMSLFATLVQRRRSPDLLPLDAPQPPASLDVCLPLVCRMVDAGSPRRAVETLLCAMHARAAGVAAEALQDDLVRPGWFALLGFRSSWPELFTSADVGEAELLRRATEGAEAERQAATARLSALALDHGGSPTMNWLAGVWMCNVARNHAMGVHLLCMSSSAGSALGSVALASCHEAGEVTSPDPATAVALFESAAVAGSCAALVAMGRAHRRGFGVQKDAGEACRRFSLAAAQGSTNGLCELGSAYQMGEGVVHDGREAVRLLRQAADLGCAHAQFLLALAYKQGDGGLPRDPVTSVRLLRQAADQGHGTALSNLAVCLMSGDGVGARDPREATRLLKIAVEKGNYLAEFNLAVCYEKGNGVRKDLEEACRLFAVAAEHGNIVAGFRAGNCYRDGVGCKKDLKLAVKYYRMAAEHGHEGSKQALTSLYA